MCLILYLPTQENTVNINFLWCYNFCEKFVSPLLAVRVEQAEKFNDPESPCNILVATDAIGMGLNL